MTAAFTDQEPEVEPVETDDLFVDGQFNSASVYAGDIHVTIGRIDDLPMSIERVKDLRDVLDRALEFHASYFPA